MAGTARFGWLLAGLALLVSIGGLAATINVPGDYAMIQAAINAAAPGDTIVVAAGTYAENLNITKSVTISGVGTDLVILEPAGAGYGIGVSGAGNNVAIENITITAGNAVYFLVHVSGVQNFTIQNVKVVGAGKTVTPGGYPLGGIDLNHVSGVVIRNVEVKNVSRNGVALTDSTMVTIEDIDVRDSGMSTGWAGVAIYATGADESFSVAFAGTNTLANTPMGIYVEDLPGAIVNLAAPAGTLVFSGQGVAPLVKYGQGSTPNLETTALELGLVGKVYAPESPTSPYNTGVAFYATVAEALAAAVIDSLQAPYTVVFDLGLDRFVVGPGMQIQRALNAAQNGDTVFVKAGTYVTQALIGKGIVLQGEPGAVIQAPGSQTYTIEESRRTLDPIIFAYGGTMVRSHVSGSSVISADVKGLVVDGQNKAQAYPIRFVGILYRNVHGEISGNVIQNMMNPGGGGGGAETFGILVYGDSVVDILNNVVSGFSRGGIGIAGDLGPAPDPVANVSGNVVIGNGPEAATDWWAENGIQIGYGATGVISGNLVTQCWVNSPSWTATGILVASTDDVVVEGNTVLDNQSGIGVAGFGFWELPASNDTVVRENDVIGNMWGVDVQMDSNNTLVIYNNIAGNTGAGVSVAQFYGHEPVGTVIRFNSIVGNALGVENYGVSTDVDAALNWWGDADGPMHASNPDGAGDGVTDNVIFSPWLGTDPDGDPTQPGVQITGLMLIIVAPVGPPPAGGYLNMAIIGANELPSADVIEIREGTYTAGSAFTAIQDAVTMVNPAGPGEMPVLEGDLDLKADGIIIGLPCQGLKIHGDITVADLVDATTCAINWNDIQGSVTNDGRGALDARFNYWYTQDFGEVQGRTAGPIQLRPYLPYSACDAYDDIQELIDAGMVPNLTAGVQQLWLKDRLGMDVGTFIRYQRGAGAGAFRAAGRGPQVAGGAGGILGGIAGGAGGVEVTLEGVYAPCQPIEGRFTVTDPATGEPVTDSAVTVTLLGAEGRLVFWGAADYDEQTGEHTFSIDTCGLEPGSYQLVIQAVGGESETLTVEIEAG
ncbi:MAG: right-handed parallel beta-helix repeat-containing protein [Candidatus Bipolaricaulaceae bacterium]